MTLAGKHALVTGAARGIGRACAEALAGHGATVLLTDVLPCKDSLNSIGKAGGEARHTHCDVSQEASVAALFRDHFGSEQAPDFVVHCAGILHEAPTLETTSADFDKTIAVNLRGSFLVGQEALRAMSRRGSGRLILIASDLAHTGREGFAPYVASKHGVLGLVRSWAKEFAPAITVNAICPGPIDTDMLGAESMSAHWREKELKIPLARFGQPEEVAAMALLLCGDGGAFITGQGLGVNGGSVMP